MFVLFYYWGARGDTAIHENRIAADMSSEYEYEYCRARMQAERTKEGG